MPKIELFAQVIEASDPDRGVHGYCAVLCVNGQWDKGGRLVTSGRVKSLAAARREARALWHSYEAPTTLRRALIRSLAAEKKELAVGDHVCVLPYRIESGTIESISPSGLATVRLDNGEVKQIHCDLLKGNEP